MSFAGTKALAHRADGLELECDILVPAALENQITLENVDRIRAKIVAEAANGPVTAEANNRLLERGVKIIPDMFLNAGGVTVSYFEWIKNLTRVRFGRMGKRFEQRRTEKLLRAVEDLTGKKLDPQLFAEIAGGGGEEDLVHSGLEETMITAFHAIREVQMQHEGMDMRTAALVLAINKIAATYLERGIFP